MPDTVDIGGLAGWVQAGGVVAFAAAVLWELKSLRPLIKEWLEAMGEIKAIMASLLERERMRAEQRQQLIELRRGDTKPPPSRERASSHWDDATDAVSLPPEQSRRNPRPKSNPRGYPVGQYGPTKPPRDDED